MTDIISQLRDSLQGGIPPVEVDPKLPSEPTLGYAAQRFFLSWKQTGGFGADEAVLLRQTLRWFGESDIRVGPQSDELRKINNLLIKAGVEWLSNGYLHAKQFCPNWQNDLAGCDERPQARPGDKHFRAEAYLASIGYEQWRSQAQKEAAWATLNTPPGTTKLVVLPTGAGKSLCFQLLPRFTSGLTVVVVPTVALAIDQQASAVTLLASLPGVNPRFFASDDMPDLTAQEVRDRQTRLLFASPEACVSGRLRPILDEFARTGWLENLVVDEAHLIETWGAHFRVEFQVLAAVRRKWLAASENRLRTFLFSATMTSECRKLLCEMFSKDGLGDEFVCQRLRPEIQYYGRKFNDSQERDQNIVEALWHLPRPAILYVTEKKEAENFYRRFREEGFRRIGCFHGDTRRAERRNLLRQWKINEIDLMVATAAFGVGVDKPDVRAVVHACYPENLDRYYQEVGRGGRDGWSSLSLLLPTDHDRHVATRLVVNLLSEELVQSRWEALFGAGRQVPGADYTYELPVESRHLGLVGDFTYGQNVRWNKRLLLQLHRANQLELLELKMMPSQQSDEESEEWAVVKVNFQPNTPKLGELVACQRDEELRYYYSGIEQLDNFLAAKKCAARVFSDLYDIKSDQRVCGGCPWCREHGRKPLDCPPLAFPLAQPSTLARSSDMVDGCPSPFHTTGRSEFLNLIHLCVTRKRLRQFLCPEARFEVVMSCFTDAFPCDAHELYRLDAVLENVVIGASVREPVVFFHFGAVTQRSIDLSKGFRAVHLLCDVKNQSDPNGRHISANEDCRFWHSPESWLLEDN